MSVVGFDFGSQNCFISIAKGGGIETITNDYSLRYTPSYISFTSKNRFIGVSAKNQALTNYKNTVFDFKNFLARKSDDAFVEKELRTYVLPFEIAKGLKDSIEFKVDYANEKIGFSPEQLTAMLFTKLKQIAETHLNTKVSDCVISCPSYFTDTQRHSLLAASQVADLNCLRITDDLVSTALAFCVYKGNELPLFTPQKTSKYEKEVIKNKTDNEANSGQKMESNDTTEDANNIAGVTDGNSEESKEIEGAEKKENNSSGDTKETSIDPGKIIVFIDMGHQALQANICRMYKNKIKVLASAFNPSLGGRDLDLALYHHFSVLFSEKYSIPTVQKLDPRSQARLIEECGKVKKLMSANSTPIPLSLESFVKEDLDVTAKVQRSEFDEMIKSILIRVEATLKDLLKETGLNPSQIERIETVGGSTRVPAIKSVIKSIFGKEPLTSLNTDEAVANGCAIQCAMLSPTFKVKDIALCDAQPYPISLIWKATGKDDGHLEIFPRYQEIPYSKVVTFYKEEPFVIEARYTYPNNIPIGDPIIGQYKILLDQSKKANPKKIKVKVRIDASGLFRIVNCNAVTLADSIKETRKEEKENAEKKCQNEETKTENEPQSPLKTSHKSNHQQQEISVEAQNRSPFMDQKYVEHLKEVECSMLARDRAEKARADAKNALEEFVYETRDKIGDSWSEFATENEKQDISKILTDTEDWLYGEGEDVKKQTYVDKLESLKKCSDPILIRYKTYQERFQGLDRINACYDHITQSLGKFFQDGGAHDLKAKMADDFEKVDRTLKCTKDWIEIAGKKLSQTPKDKDPGIGVDAIKVEIQKLESTCFPVLQKLQQAFNEKNKKNSVSESSKNEISSDKNVEMNDEANKKTENTKKMEVD
ncbi:unnamed protein product [Gordionus sp. m RMFG-2023]|uniref:heat shock protein 105 kDa-like isoform X2 n=1 Tax=Gordionus sp. m RMFG-2023 TaxID=3053472 RepID=UPI0030DF4A93